MIAMFFHVLRRGYWIVLAAVVGAAAARYYVSHFVTPIYEATAKIYIAGSDSAITESDLKLGSSLAKDFQEAFSIGSVCEAVNEKLGLTYSYETLSGMISTSNPKGSHLLYITARSSKPEEARDVANAYTEAVQDYIENVMEMRRPQLLETARKPKSPVSPNKRRFTKNGAVTGGLTAAMVLVLLFLMDDRIRSAEDIMKAVQLPVFGEIPLYKLQRAAPSQDASDPSVEGMPQARLADLLFLGRQENETIDTISTGISFAGNRIRKVVVTSCGENEGKTFAALQLSLSMARRGKRTLLVDCDLRNSVMRKEKLLRLSGKKTGLAHLLSGQCELSDVLYATNVPNLFLIPNGENVKSSLSLLSSPDFDRMLEKLSREYDAIFLDTPPLGVVDAVEAARRCDGSLLVVESKKTSQKGLKEAADRLRKTGTPILGCILNKTSARRTRRKAG